jgi:hypothetical protein
MALTRRYAPAFNPGEASTIGLDFSHLLPPGVGISTCTVAAFTNTSPPVASSDFIFGTVTARGRNVWCTISGGVAGTDYQIRWNATGTDGNVWPRTTLLLCALTS